MSSNRSGSVKFRWVSITIINKELKGFPLKILYLIIVLGLWYGGNYCIFLTTAGSYLHIYRIIRILAVLQALWSVYISHPAIMASYEYQITLATARIYWWSILLLSSGLMSSWMSSVDPVMYKNTPNSIVAAEIRLSCGIILEYSSINSRPW
jgi:hypothetical protein